jgi:hypothetical protein
MRNYVITLSPSSEEMPYILDIFPSGIEDSKTRHKLYTPQGLEQDMIDCIHTNKAGFDDMMKRITATGSWTTEVSLSDECAARLGWTE